MLDYSPKAFVIDYSHVLDRSLIRFFREHNDSFTNVNGIYCLGKGFTKSKLKKLFEGYIKDDVSRIVSEIQAKEQYSCFASKRVFIVGSCFPADNVIADKNKFSDDMLKIKHYLKEQDIKLDLVLFENIWAKIFSSMMKKQTTNGIMNDSDIRVFFVSNNNLDSRQMIGIIEQLFGKKSVHVLNHDPECLVQKPQIYAAEAYDQNMTYNIEAVSLIVSEARQFLTHLM